MNWSCRQPSIGLGGSSRTIAACGHKSTNILQFIIIYIYHLRKYRNNDGLVSCKDIKIAIILSLLLLLFSYLPLREEVAGIAMTLL